MKINKYSINDFDKMRKAGRLAARALEYICSKVVCGITTQQLDDYFLEFLRDNGGNPACKGYYDYPKNICVSINDEICHGIPGNKILKEGDVVSVDLVVELDGFHGDTCRTVIIGNSNKRTELLVLKTYESLMKCIEEIKPGMYISEIGRIIESVVKPVGFDIVKQYCGHGIGKNLHEDPQILHYYQKSDILIEPGMCFTIEPMITMGKGDSKIDSDGWTVRTKDRGICAQFEHTLGVNDQYLEIFTTVI